jgi:hypothetical protein
MSNPFGENMFTPQPAYGDVARQTQLLKEAPISGAPTPGATAPTPRPAPSGGGAVPDGIMQMPAAHPKAEYYARLAATWGALAKMPGASEQVKLIAKAAKKTMAKQAEISQQVGR